MFVMTVDQRKSRSSQDEVPALLDYLNATYGDKLLLAFERTAGDEVQCLTDSAQAVVDIWTDLLRQKGWYTGVGVGHVDTPLPDHVRAGRGIAFIHARDAVERAKRSPAHVSVTGDDAVGAKRAESALMLMGNVLERRSREGWEAVDVMRQASRQREVAEKLGISVQAVSLRLRAAGWTEEQRGVPLAVWLLSAIGDSAKSNTVTGDTA